jgi:hypothetical protein
MERQFWTGQEIAKYFSTEYFLHHPVNRARSPSLSIAVAVAAALLIPSPHPNGCHNEYHWRKSIP